MAGGSVRQAGQKAPWKEVALPTEHGGWSLTAEPVVLGLLVAWSWPGLALGVAAVLAFVARTPVKTVLVDRFRHRWLPRTALAARIAAVELAAIVTLALIAAVGAQDTRFWVPLAAAGPLIAAELYYDMRSRGRRLIPEVAGTVGISAVVAAICLVGGEPRALAAGLWAVIASRAVGAVFYARTMVFRAHGRPVVVWHSDLAQLAGVGAVTVAWLLDAIGLAPVLALVGAAGFNLVAVRGPVRPAKIIGLQQLALGVMVIVVTAAAVLTTSST